MCAKTSRIDKPFWVLMAFAIVLLVIAIAVSVQSAEADDLSFWAFTKQGDWRVSGGCHLSQRQVDSFRFDYFQEAQRGVGDKGWDLTVSQKQGWAEFQTKLVRKQRKDIRTEEWSAVGTWHGLGLGLAVSTLDFDDAVFQGKARYTLRHTSPAGEASAFLEAASNWQGNRQLFTAEPRLKLPTIIGRLAIVLSGHYQLLDDGGPKVKEFWDGKVEFVIPLGAKNDS